MFPPQEKIIVATIACIERSGIQSLTNREIAREAGVNSAAINYYFGSKDNLIAAVMRSTINEMVKIWGESKEAAAQDPEQTIRIYLSTLFDGCFRYPGIARAHLFTDYFYPEFKSPIREILLEQMPEFVEYLVIVCKLSSRDEGRAFALNLFSTVILSSLLPDLYSGIFGEEFSAEETRKRYLDMILNRLIKN